MKKYSLIFLAIFLTGCLATPAPTANPAEVGLTMFADKINAEATQAAVNSVFTATAQIYAVTATYQAAGTQEAVTQQARMDAQATADQDRKDAQATQQRIDADARATQQRIDADATQAQARRDAEATSAQARLDVESTQQAQGTATAFSVTQAVLPTHALWTQQAVEQQVILGTNAVELSNLEVQQQRQTNTIDWALPSLAAIGLTITAVVYVLRHSRTREIKDEDGKVQVLIFDNQTALKPGLMAKPVLELKAMNMPDLASPAEQARVTERSQMIEALAAMPAQTSNSAAGAFNTYFSSTREKPYDIIDAEQLPPTGLLDPQALKSIENDWKEANKDG